MRLGCVDTRTVPVTFVHALLFSETEIEAMEDCAAVPDYTAHHIRRRRRRRPDGQGRWGGALPRRGHTRVRTAARAEGDSQPRVADLSGRALDGCAGEYGVQLPLLPDPPGGGGGGGGGGGVTRGR